MENETPQTSSLKIPPVASWASIPCLTTLPSSTCRCCCRYSVLSLKTAIACFETARSTGVAQGPGLISEKVQRMARASVSWRKSSDWTAARGDRDFIQSHTRVPSCRYPNPFSAANSARAGSDDRSVDEIEGKEGADETASKTCRFSESTPFPLSAVRCSFSLSSPSTLPERAYCRA